MLHSAAAAHTFVRPSRDGTFTMTVRTDLYHGLFRWERTASGQTRLSQHPEAPASIPDPESGWLLRVATLDARAQGICPVCTATEQGGYVSFVQDLRLAYACPSCEQLVWLKGA
jgi:hypothetical protein